MGKKTVGFNKSGLDKLPNDKPAVYKIKTESGNANYVGSAKRGRVQERLQEHMPGGARIIFLDLRYKSSRWTTYLRRVKKNLILF